jgi:hypothetical protein
MASETRAPTLALLLREQRWRGRGTGTWPELKENAERGQTHLGDICGCSDVIATPCDTFLGITFGFPAGQQPVASADAGTGTSADENVSEYPTESFGWTTDLSSKPSSVRTPSFVEKG